MSTSASLIATAKRPADGRRGIVAATIGYGLDGFDLLLLSFALTPIVATFGLSDVEAGSLATITLLGAMSGGFGFGMLSDRLGRVRVLVWAVGIFGVFTALTAFAQGYPDLAIYRFLAGVGIGGEFGIGMALAAEAVPAGKRTRATSMVAIGCQLGVLAAAIISAPVISMFGWRGLFIVGAIPAVAVLLVRSQISESTVFQSAQRDRQRTGARAGSPRALFQDVKTTRITLAIIVLTCVQNCGFFGIMTWLPHYLATQIGLDVSGSALWTAVTICGMIVGILGFGTIADQIGLRFAFWIFQAGAVVSIIGYSLLTDAIALLIGGFIMGIFANGMLGGYGALIARHYGVNVRATAQNVMFNIGRGVGGFAPLVIASVATSFGFPAALAGIAVIYVLAFAAMLLIPELSPEHDRTVG